MSLNQRADAIVVSAYPHIAFHAQRQWLPLPFAPLEEVLEYGKARGASHLAVETRNIERRPVEQQKLLEEPDVQKRAESLIAYLETRLEIISITAKKKDEIISKRNLN